MKNGPYSSFAERDVAAGTMRRPVCAVQASSGDSPIRPGNPATSVGSSETSSEPEVTRSHIYLQAKSGRRDELVQTLDRLEVLTAARGQPGFLAAEIQASVEDQNRLLVSSSWASREHHERWRTGRVCQDMFRQIAEFVAADPDVRVFQVIDAVQ